MYFHTKAVNIQYAQCLFVALVMLCKTSKQEIKNLFKQVGRPCVGFGNVL